MIEQSMSTKEYQQKNSAEIQGLSTSINQFKDQLLETYSRAVDKANENATSLVEEAITTHIDPLKLEKAALKNEIKALSEELQMLTEGETPTKG